jgi:DNA-binding GntR family transcriptional regulator
MVAVMEIPAQNSFSNPSAPLLLRTQVYEYLRNELKAENLTPGMFISMNQLMKNLGISRTPLRDALLQLQTEGFVTFLPQRGIRINKLTQQDIEYMYEMLGALDSRLLLAAFEKLGPAEIEQISIILNQLNIIRQRLFEFGKKDWSSTMREMNYNEHLEMIELIQKGKSVQAADFMRDVHCIINY